MAEPRAEPRRTGGVGSNPEGPSTPQPVSSPGAPQKPDAVSGGERPLTPEEQMALYEEDLKETDWGHQPC